MIHHESQADPVNLGLGSSASSAFLSFPPLLLSWQPNFDQKRVWGPFSSSNRCFLVSVQDLEPKRVPCLLSPKSRAEGFCFYPFPRSIGCLNLPWGKKISHYPRPQHCNAFASNNRMVWGSGWTLVLSRGAVNHLLHICATAFIVFPALNFVHDNMRSDN